MTYSVVNALVPLRAFKVNDAKRDPALDALLLGFTVFRGRLIQLYLLYFLPWIEVRTNIRFGASFIKNPHEDSCFITYNN